MHTLSEAKYPPALQEKARRIATTGRIVVGEFVPEPWRQEVEFRLFLAALGELVNDRVYSITTSDVF